MLDTAGTQNEPENSTRPTYREPHCICAHLELNPGARKLARVPQKGTQEMTQTIYGLIQSGNRYYYAIGEQAYIIQIQSFPAAWRKTPSTSWQRTHGQLQLLRLDMLGLGILELDPLAEFDRSAVKVYRLHSSNGKFEYEPDWGR